MRTSKKNSRGFTLVELMIVVVIVAILAGIAIPSYQSSVQKGRRTDAKETLLSAAALQEKHYMQHNAYSSSTDTIGGNESGEGYYSISLAQPCGADTCYQVTATAQGAQVKDDDCAAYSINQAGTKTAVNSGGANSTDKCW